MGSVVPAESALARVAERFRGERAPLGDPEQRIRELLAEEAPLLTADEAAGHSSRLLGDLVGLGPLEPLLADESVTDVFVNGPGRVWIEREGTLVCTEVVVDRAQLSSAIERIVSPLGLRSDRSHPIVDARRADGTRVAVVLPPVAPDGPLLALRRHRGAVLSLGDFGPPAVVEILETVVQRGDNVVVHGPTGSGKTTLVAAMCGRLGEAVRLVLIEDTAELQVHGPSVVRLEARPGTAEGAGRVELRQLVRTALRLRPDRVVVGEVRGPEAADMVWALSTGHRGSMSTVHAGDARDAVARLEVMVAMGVGPSVPARAVREQVGSAVDVLIGVGRGPGGSRRVTQVHRLGRGGLRVVHPTDLDRPTDLNGPCDLDAVDRS